MKMQLER